MVIRGESKNWKVGDASKMDGVTHRETVYLFETLHANGTLWENPEKIIDLAGGI